MIVFFSTTGTASADSSPFEGFPTEMTIVKPEENQAADGSIGELHAPLEIYFHENSLQEKVSHLIKKRGTWSYEFVLVHKNGSNQIITQSNKHDAVIPASTMKLFTGWVGFKKKVVNDAYLWEMLHHSWNNDAEKVLRLIGGKSVLQKYVSEVVELHDDGKGFKVADGSGYSEHNRVTANIEFRLLRAIRFRPEYDRFKELLAQPGDRGTLASRMLPLRNRLFAKTGTMPNTGVASLAGFLETKQGLVIFSIIGNDMSGKHRSARRTIDEIVMMHAKHLNK